MTRLVAAFVESNTTGHGEELLHVARQLDLEPVLLARDPGRYPFAAGIARTLSADTADPGAVLAVLRDLPGRIALVTSASDRFVETAARVAAALHLRGPDPEAVAGCNDKARQREVLAAAGVAVPQWMVAGDAASAAACAEHIGGPLVVKPVTGSGSVGVRLCTTADEVAAHAGRLLAGAVDERGEAMPGAVLVEQVVPGRELSVEILGGEVAGVTETRLGAPPYFIEVGHEHPARLTTSETERVTGLALAAVRALGLADQNAHVELRVTADAAWIIEVNPRLPGGRITTLVRVATDVDMLAAHLRTLLGEPLVSTPGRRSGAAIGFAVNPPEGTRPDLDEVRACPGVVDVAYDRFRAGTGAYGDFRDRAGWVIAEGADAGEAAERVESALEVLTGAARGCLA
ncbi:ATP-grasp domain-containing protein [Solicola gregarius]|uniref:ATP-grasp domain-containing protein n=1 Tax=Solicola gregarius TaxID=2908642 RepID=A0AA46TEH0_9ACTN|nr:ATP-grasp domain-containing protein [Solicola gregarius]UYM03650.1 ATP-grasp domain-containing protein [Solicola gregarius]